VPVRIPSRTSDLVCLGALLMFVAGLCLVPVTETDVFFRLKVGQEIWARHALLGENLFSFTAPHHPDLDASWAFEVALAGLYRLGGFPAIVLAKTTVLLGVFAAGYSLCRRAGCTAATSAGVLASAAFVMSARFVERPHVMSFAGEVVVLWAVARARTPWSARRFVAFTAAMCLWANTHAGIFVAVGVLGATALGAWPIDRVAARRDLVLAGLAAAAALATPLGFEIVRYWILHVRIPRLHPVDEFRAATWRSDPYFLLWVVALAGCVATQYRCCGLARRADAPGTDRAAPVVLAMLPQWLPAASLVGLGCLSVRFSADAVLMTAPLVAQTWRLATEGRQREKMRMGAAGFPIAALVTATLLVGMTLLSRIAERGAGWRRLDIGVDREGLPGDAIAFVEGEGLRERMYNDYELGSYLAFQGFPRYRVFIDPRLPAYPEAMHRLLGRFDVSRAEWDAEMERYGVDSALLTYAGINRRVSSWDPQRWALVYRRSDARVFVRRLPRWRALIARLEIPATFSFTVEDGTATIPLVEQPIASPVSDCEWQLRLGDLMFELDEGRDARAQLPYRRALQPPGCLAAADEARLSAWLGRKELAAAHPERAVARLSRALELEPANEWTHASRAEALERLGRLREARDDWQLVARAAVDPRLRAAATRRLAQRSQ
jgi:hypothetical protein